MGSDSKVKVTRGRTRDMKERLKKKGKPQNRPGQQKAGYQKRTKESKRRQITHSDADAGGEREKDVSCNHNAKQTMSSKVKHPCQSAGGSKRKEKENGVKRRSRKQQMKKREKGQEGRRQKMIKVA